MKHERRQLSFAESAQRRIKDLNSEWLDTILTHGDDIPTVLPGFDWKTLPAYRELEKEQNHLREKLDVEQASMKKYEKLDELLNRILEKVDLIPLGYGYELEECECPTAGMGTENQLDYYKYWLGQDKPLLKYGLYFIASRGGYGLCAIVFDASVMRKTNLLDEYRGAELGLSFNTHALPSALKSEEHDSYDHDTFRDCHRQFAHFSGRNPGGAVYPAAADKLKYFHQCVVQAICSILSEIGGEYKEIFMEDKKEENE